MRWPLGDLLGVLPRLWLPLGLVTASALNLYWAWPRFDAYEACRRRFFAAGLADETVGLGEREYRLANVCPNRPWPILCNAAWLTCHETEGCPVEARWMCRQALCASVSNLNDCNPLAPSEATVWNDLDMVHLAGGRAMGVEVSNAGLAELRRLVNPRTIGRVVITPEMMTWGMGQVIASAVARVRVEELRPFEPPWWAD